MKKKLVGKQPVIHFKNNVLETPFVSVIVATYNHDKFIEY